METAHLFSNELNYDFCCETAIAQYKSERGININNINDLLLRVRLFMKTGMSLNNLHCCLNY